MSYSAESAEFEFEPWRSSTVTLPATAIDWAVQVCQQEPDAAQQWPTFLRAMAVQGLQQWLEAGAQDIALYYDRNRPPNPAVTCGVNDFRLAVVAQGSLSDEVVTISQSSLEDAANFAHLYVLAEVQEEADQVTILAGLRRDRLLAHQRQGELVAQADGTYRVPVQYFDTSPEDILLYLNCLAPEQLAVASPASASAPTPARISLLTQRAGDLINAGRWLRDQLDTVADGLAWTLLPPLAPAHAMMSTSTPAEELEAVLRDLEPAGVSIPITARGAYTDLQQFGLPFRLYALTWTMFEPRPPEWSLFLFLGPVPGEQLPPGTRLVVRDAEAILAEQTLSPDLDAAYLYAQVIGTWDEQFTAMVELPNGTTLNWPPFVFRP
ncbi:MAG: DUF1822 family protein [Nodosilinea sp.]